MVHLIIYLKYGTCMVILTDLESALKIRKTFQEFSEDYIKSVNEKKEPIERLYSFSDESGLGTSIWMGHVAGIHIAPFKENLQEKMAKMLEKHIGEGEDWKKEE